MKEHEEAQRKIKVLESEMESMRAGAAAAPPKEPTRESPSQRPPAAGGCGCVVM